MLRKIRICLAALFFIGVTLLFVLPSEWYHEAFGWMAKVQFLPAVLALNVGVIVLLVLVTLLFGRVYCSVICPLGITQDIVSWFSSRRKGKKKRFSWSPEVKWLRYGVWVVFIFALILGIHAIVALLAPYSTYGRFVRSILHPAGQWANLAVVVAVFCLVAILAWKNGRTWCNTVCPVGTTLSFFSRFSLFRPVIDTEKCRKCHVCEKGCKAACINIDAQKIDYSRCVDCFDCIDSCKFGALHYRFAYGRKSSASADVPSGDGKKAPDGGKRAFIASSAIAVGSAATAKVVSAAVAAVSAVTAASAQGQSTKKLDGGLAEVLPKQKPERSVRLTPFGSKSVKNFYDHCTACQLCISACPNMVLRPSTDLEHFMQPEMSYENGYCRPECTLCSQVCPAGAILPLTPEEKTAVHIGVASVQRDLCIVERDGVSCGNCARHCPVGAIMMVHKNSDDRHSPMIPAVNESLCIGCGACENLCPSRPISAIRVNGRQVHVID